MLASSPSRIGWAIFFSTRMCAARAGLGFVNDGAHHFMGFAADCEHHLDGFARASSWRNLSVTRPFSPQLPSSVVTKSSSLTVRISSSRMTRSRLCPPTDCEQGQVRSGKKRHAAGCSVDRHPLQHRNHRCFLFDTEERKYPASSLSLQAAAGEFFDARFALGNFTPWIRGFAWLSGLRVLGQGPR
jgi:hypothetical protein